MLRQKLVTVVTGLRRETATMAAQIGEITSRGWNATDTFWDVQYLAS
jgi:hypothetical protein